MIASTFTTREHSHPNGFRRSRAWLTTLMEFRLVDDDVIKIKDVLWLAVIAGLVAVKLWAGVGWYVLIPMEIFSVLAATYRPRSTDRGAASVTRLRFERPHCYPSSGNDKR